MYVFFSLQLGSCIKYVAASRSSQKHLFPAPQEHLFPAPFLARSYGTSASLQAEEG